VTPREAIKHLRTRTQEGEFSSETAEAIRTLCDTHPASEERAGENVGAVWTHPKGNREPKLFGPMTVVKVFEDSCDVHSSDVLLLMSDGENWSRDELDSAGWLPERKS
jgi:hypothetical protein